MYGLCSQVYYSAAEDALGLIPVHSCQQPEEATASPPIRAENMTVRSRCSAKGPEHWQKGAELQLSSSDKR